MASSDFFSAKFGFFVAVIGLGGVSYYASTLRADLRAQKEAVAQYVSENKTLQSNIEKLTKDNGANVEAIAACNKAVADAEAKLTEMQKKAPSARKR